MKTTTLPTPVTQTEFANLVNQIFNEQNALYTDVYIQPGYPLRARVTGNQWAEFLVGQGEKAQRVTFTDADFDKLLSNLFKHKLEHTKPATRWQELLDKANGCLHPMISLQTAAQDGKPEQTFRVRCTLQRQDMGKYGLMLRCLRPVSDSLEDLGLPATLRTLWQAKHGLVLVTGRTGAGKSTSIAAMLNQINKERSSNIVVIEDPIEFVHTPNKASFTYREVGVDVDTYANGVEQVLRYVPDVISIGEIRDAETMRAAVRAGESGHLVFCTIHAANAVGAIRKALGYLDSSGEKLAFANNVVGVIAQALLPTINSAAKALAYEVMDFTARQNGVSYLAETVEKMISSSSDGSELQKFETDFYNETTRLGIGSLPFLQSLRFLVKNNKIDVKSGMSLLTNAQAIKELKDLSSKK